MVVYNNKSFSKINGSAKSVPEIGSSNLIGDKTLYRKQDISIIARIFLVQDV